MSRGKLQIIVKPETKVELNEKSGDDGAHMILSEDVTFGRGSTLHQCFEIVTVVSSSVEKLWNLP